MALKRAFEYVLGVDLWRHYGAKERQIYQEAGVSEAHPLPFERVQEERQKFINSVVSCWRTMLVAKYY